MNSPAAPAILPAPEAGGVTDARIVERASATPAAPRAPAGPPGRRRRGMAVRSATSRAAPRTLAGLQTWFQDVISDPADPRDPHGVIRAGGDFPVERRLGVYHYGYQARLEDCLIDDFPAVRQAVGAERFTGLCAAYRAAHPSRVRTLNLFGADFPAFLRTTRLPRKAALADLAALEWALVEVMHAQAAPVLDAAALTRIPLERWAGARFTPAKTLRIVVAGVPVNAWLNALRDAPSPAIPKAGWSAVAVYRKGFDLWRMPLTRPMHRVLAGLVAGETLGEALATLEQAPARERAAIAAKVMDWFGAWVAGGCFARVRV